MKKYALLIGINYIGKTRQLKGCINDIIMMRKYLIKKRNYSANNIIVLRDDDSSFLIPDKDNIINKFTELINIANTNKASEIFFHYSGHGERSVDNNGDEISTYDNFIIPVNYVQGEINSYIRDDIIREIISNLNNTTKLLSVMDCCNSATNLDLPYLYNYNKSGKKILLIQDNSQQYANLLDKNIYSLSASKDDQLSVSAPNVYRTMTNSKNPKFAINKSDRYGGILTSTLLKILNKKNTGNFSNILNELNNKIRKPYSQESLLASSKKIYQVQNKGDINIKILIKRFMSNKGFIQIKRNRPIKRIISFKRNRLIKRNRSIKRNIPIKRNRSFKRIISFKRNRLIKRNRSIKRNIKFK
jgi:hypothetical protein